MKDCGSEIIELRSITLYCIEMELRREFETSFGKSLKLPKILVKVIDSSGEEGWGEVVAGEGPWYSYETWETALLILE
ncbi:MAG TPA: o-succinylbenzoate synthase, partial [Thermofilaceae archaeon]|nr:o-succinylbenzoate synthase [Thermofilaceae archaeon]